MASFGDYNRVNTNVTAMDARLSLNKINKELGDSRLKLSTGFKINKAEDDAAGFAIATKLKSRVAGLEQGLQNVSDAKSVLDVAEGAYSTVVDNLIEMKSLATQAANGTIAVGSDEMGYIASQLEALAKDINDIAKSTTYNGIDLMDSAQSLTFQVGEGTDDTMDVALSKVNMSSLFNTAGTDGTISTTETLGDDTNGGTSTSFVYDGASTGDTGTHLFDAIDASLTDTTVQAATTYNANTVANGGDDLIDDQTPAIADASAGDGQYSVSVVNSAANNGAGADNTAGEILDTEADGFSNTDTIIVNGKNDGDTFNFAGIQVLDTSTAGVANDIVTVAAGSQKTAAVQETTITGVTGSTILVREDDSTDNSSLLFIDEDKVNHADMNAFIGHIDSAIGKMNEYTNQIGIDQRSLSGKEVNLSEAITSNSAARSRIMDTDFAKEQSNSIRLQILQQTATAALSQANMGPQAVLSFLG
jgi:flagellin